MIIVIVFWFRARPYGDQSYSIFATRYTKIAKG